MSALEGLGSGSKTFLKIMAVTNPDTGKPAGAFVQTTTKDNPKATVRNYVRKDKTSGTAYELYYRALNGLVTDVKGVKREFDVKGVKREFKEWNINISTPEGEFVITLPLGFFPKTRGILWRLGNADLSKEIKFHVGVDGDGNAFTWITQEGVTVPQVWSKDNPGKMPPLVQKEVKGETVWDDSDQIKFFAKKYLPEVLGPKLQEAAKWSEPEEITPVQLATDLHESLLGSSAGEVSEVIEEEDDLPF